MDYFSEGRLGSPGKCGSLGKSGSRIAKRGSESIAASVAVDEEGGEEAARPLVVVKVGGSCLSSREDLESVADQLAETILSGVRLVVVVSAFRGVTDSLLREAREKGVREPAELDAHLSKGEADSARLLSAALRARGVHATAIDPGSEFWPVMTDGRHGDANPLVEETRDSARAYLSPMISGGVTPVVCGFVGMCPHGSVTTMGRGGSDATALLLGRVLGACEVVLVKDVDGMYSADPKHSVSARHLPVLSAGEALRMSEAGAKVVQPKALRLKAAEVPLRIVGNGSGRGTLIVGGVQ